MSNATLKFQDLLPISSDLLIDLLSENNINFNLYNHTPLFSVKETKEQQNLIFPTNNYAVHIKNFYLRDKKKNNFLFTCEQDKNVDLKFLKELINSDRLSFGSPERLYQNLGVFPGAVSPFCMLNGKKNKVQFFCDCNLKQFTYMYLHPFVNDRTICLDINDLEKFLRNHNIKINWIKL